MFRTPLLKNRLLLYGSTITRILRKFNVTFRESVPEATKKFGRKAIIVLGFDRCNEKWVKNSYAKSHDTLVAVEDDQMLNDIYTADQLLNFYLGARAQAVAHPIKAKTSAAQNVDMDVPPSTKELSASDAPPISEGSIQ